MINEGVRFILTLKDHMSGAMPKIARSAQSAFSKVDAGARKAKREIDLTGRSVNTLERALRMVERRRDISIDSRDVDVANRKIDQLKGRIRQLKTSGTEITPTGVGRGRSAGMLGGFGYGRMMLTAGMIGGTALVGAGFRKAASSGLQAGANLVSFQTMAGEQQGSKLYRNLTKFAQDSIFGNEVYKMAQTQLAFGANAKSVMPDLKMLGDVSMGDKGRLQSLNLAYSQVRSAGKLMGQDLLQFVNAGFNPLQQISEETGKSMSQLRKDMSDGKISFDQVRGAFLQATSAGGKFYKMTERIADTPFGKVEALRGQWDGVMLKAGEAMAPAIGKAIDKYASPLVSFIGKHIVPTANGLMNYGSELAEPLSRLAKTTGDLIQPVAQLISSDEVKDLTKALIDVGADIGKQLVPVIKDLAIAIKPFAGTAAGIAKWMGTGMSYAEKKEKVLQYRANADSIRMAAPGAFNMLNTVLSGPQGNVNVNDIWKKFTKGKDAALFGSANLTPRSATAGNTVKDIIQSTNSSAGGSGSYGTHSTDAITAPVAKMLNININANPFHIENMNVETAANGLQGMDVRRLELLFNDWFGRMLQSAGYAMDN